MLAHITPQLPLSFLPQAPIAEVVPRPVTVLAGSVADLLAAKQARELEAQNRILRANAIGGDDPFHEGGATSPNGGAAGGSGRNSSPSGAGASARTPRGRTALSRAVSRANGGGGGGAAAAANTGGAAASTSGGGAAAEGAGAAGEGGEDPAMRLFKPQPVAVLVATGDGGTDRVYRFPRLLLPSAQHMCLFEHVDGCRFCEALYGHYLLPNGTLAHFYLGDTVVKVRGRGEGGGNREEEDGMVGAGLGCSTPSQGE